MKTRITLKDIAKEFDVSISTVSKALKNSKEIGKETRENIQAFAKSYNYRPNTIALSLKNRKTKKIGVIIPEIVHHFFSVVINGIEKVAMERGYNVVIALSNESFEKEVVNLETLVDSSIDGFIMSLAKETLLKKDYHHINQSIRDGFPVVLFDRTTDEINCDKVIINDTEASKMATNHLLKLGRKKILILTTEDYITVGKDRTKGYVDAINDSSIALDPNLIIKTVDTKKSSIVMLQLESEIENAFKINPDIDAILAVNEIYAASALHVIDRLNLTIPKDVALICFTDGLISRYSKPTLTTVSQHGEIIGSQAANLLIDRLENKTSDTETFTKVVQCSLIVRDSV